MVAGIAKRGINVIGVDIDARAINAVSAGRAPVRETDLDTTIRTHRLRIRATGRFEQAVQESEISFVVVPTPSDGRGAFSLKHASAAFREIGRALKNKSAYHLVVLTSTVLPGSMRYGLIPLLEQESGKRAGEGFGVCYSPEFIALGSVIRDFLNPDFTLVGELDARSGDLLEAAYTRIVENDAPCKRMSLENAELAKTALNAYVTMKISFANMLADLCERIPGGDIDVVTDALGTDRRIGSRYLKGAIGYGGPCFPRDNVALGFISRALGTRAPLAEMTDAINRGLPGRSVERLRTLLKPGQIVGVLGLAYKPYSEVVEESQGLALARAFATDGFRVVAYDPLASLPVDDPLHAQVECAASVRECLEQADAVFITTPDPVFAALKAADFNRGGRRRTVVDFWRLLERELNGQCGIQYVGIGRNEWDPAAVLRLEALWSDGRGE